LEVIFKMAHVASRTSIGFEPIYNKTVTTIPNPVAYELTPSTTFTKGDMVVLTNGKVALATAASVTDILGVMAESVVSDATSIMYGKVYDHPDNVYRCTFVDHLDSTATGGDATSLIDTGLSTSSNDVWNGALLYVYAGTNAGCMRTVSDYVGGDDKLVVTAPFPDPCDTTTKYILLGAGAGAGDVINVGSTGIVLKDEDSIDANASILSSGAEVGPLVCVGVSKVADLMLDVMIMRSKHIFG
jgi:hypothetical protein